MILFCDLESAPEYEKFDELPEAGKKSFEKKFKYRVDNGDYPDLAAVYEAEAGLYAEYSKIICLAVGMEVSDKTKGDYFYVRGFIGDEIDILSKFLKIEETIRPSHLCAHNGKAFDFPFIARRCIINGLPLPELLNTGTKRPWEVPLLDTMEMWRFTDLRSYASLITLCYVLGIPSPKTDIEGSQVKTAYYSGELQKIKHYCMRDVVALYQIYYRIKGIQHLTQHQMV